MNIITANGVDYKMLAKKALFHLRNVSFSRNSFTPDVNARIWGAHQPRIKLRTEEVEQMHQKAVEFLKLYDTLAVNPDQEERMNCRDRGLEHNYSRVNGEWICDNCGKLESED